MNDDELRDELLAAEPASPELERRYRLRLRELLVRPFPPAERAGLVIGGLGAIGVGAWIASLLGSARTHSHPGGVLAGWAGIACCALIAVSSLFMLWRGKEHVIRDRRIMTGVVVGAIATMVAVAYWASAHLPDPARGNRLLLVGVLAWVIGALPCYVAHVVHQCKVEVRMDVMRLELAIADLGDRLARRNG